jgi:hypothetical protein
LLGVAWLEGPQRRLRLKRVEQPLGKAAMQRAHDRLVGAHRRPVGAVAELEAHAAWRCASRAWLKAERGKDRVQALLEGEWTRISGQLAADSAPGDFKLAQALGSGWNRAGQPAGEGGVGVRAPAGRLRLGADRPAGARAPARLLQAVVIKQSSGLETLEVHANTAAVQSEVGGELVRRRRAPKLSQDGEQPATATPRAGRARASPRSWGDVPPPRLPRGRPSWACPTMPAIGAPTTRRA